MLKRKGRVGTTEVYSNTPDSHYSVTGVCGSWSGGLTRWSWETSLNRVHPVRDD